MRPTPLLFAAAAAMMLLATSAVVNPCRGETFVDKEFGYAIDFPEGWKVAPSLLGKARVKAMYRKDGRKATLFVYEGPNGIGLGRLTPDQVCREYCIRAEEYPVTVDDYGSEVIDGLEAVWMQSTVEVMGLRRASLDYYFPHGDRYFQVSATAQPDLYPLMEASFRNSARSFRLLESWEAELLAASESTSSPESDSDSAGAPSTTLLAVLAVAATAGVAWFVWSLSRKRESRIAQPANNRQAASVAESPMAPPSDSARRGSPVPQSTGQSTSIERHSGVGIASLVVSLCAALVSGAMLLLWALLAAMIESDAGTATPAEMLLGVGFIVGVSGGVAGLVLGVIGLRRRGRKKCLAVAGTVIGCATVLLCMAALGGFLSFVLSLVVTWMIGLAPPVLIRYVVLRRPIGKRPAIAFAAVQAVLNVAVFVALGSQSRTHYVLIVIAYMAYTILHHGFNGTSPASTQT